MQRLTPLPDTRPQDALGFNRLHHVCLLWVDYLRAVSEAERQALRSHCFHQPSLFRIIRRYFQRKTQNYGNEQIPRP